MYIEKDNIMSINEKKIARRAAADVLTIMNQDIPKIKASIERFTIPILRFRALNELSNIKKQMDIVQQTLDNEAATLHDILSLHRPMYQIMTSLTVLEDGLARNEKYAN